MIIPVIITYPCVVFVNRELQLMRFLTVVHVSSMVTFRQKSLMYAPVLPAKALAKFYPLYVHYYGFWTSSSHKSRGNPINNAT